MNAYVFKELIELIISAKHINQFRDNLEATSLQKPEGMELNGFNGYEVYYEEIMTLCYLCWFYVVLSLSFHMFNQ